MLRAPARLASALLFGFLTLLLVRPAVAGVDRFTPSGPWRGQIVLLVADPFAPGSLLAITDYYGLYRSDDGGRSWAFSGAGLDNQRQQGLVADPTNRGSFYLLTVTGVFHSSDGGRNWRQVAAGRNFDTPIFPHERLLPSVALLPGGPGAPPTLLVGTLQDLQRSGDGGVTWNRVYTSPFLGLLHAISDPTDPSRVWLDLPGGGVQTSTDGGRTWTPVSTLPDFVVVTLVLPTRPATIFATGNPGVFKSTDEGATWRKLPQPISPSAYDPATPTNVYGTNGTSFFFSADAGETWAPRGAGLPTTGLGALLAASNSRTLYTLSGNDFSGSVLLTSPDRGQHWSTIAASSGRSGFRTSLFFRPGDPQTVYALHGNQAFRSRNGGATWTSFATLVPPLATTTVFDLAIDPTSPDLLYAAAASGVFRSTDGGDTWDLLSPQHFTRIVPAGRRTLFGASCGISRSQDGGKSWTTVLACPAAGGQSIDRFFFDRNPNLVYAQGTDTSGILPRAFKSTDSGATWKPLVPDGGVLAVDPTKSGRLYVTRPTGLFRSNDSGLTFQKVSSFAAAGSKLDVRALLVDPATPSTLYAAVASGQGVFRSTDGGVTWVPIGANLARYNGLLVLNLALHPTVPHLLYAITEGGLFQNQLTVP